MLRDEPLEKEGPVPHLGRRDPFRSQAGEGGGRPRECHRGVDGGSRETQRRKERHIDTGPQRQGRERAIERHGEEKEGRELADPAGLKSIFM